MPTKPTVFVFLKSIYSWCSKMVSGKWLPTKVLEEGPVFFWDTRPHLTGEAWHSSSLNTPDNHFLRNVKLIPITIAKIPIACQLTKFIKDTLLIKFSIHLFAIVILRTAKQFQCIPPEDPTRYERIQVMKPQCF